MLKETSYFGKEPSSEESKDDGIVGLMVMLRHSNVRTIPQLPLPFIQLPCSRVDVKEDDVRIALNQPTTVQNLPVETSSSHVISLSVNHLINHVINHSVNLLINRSITGSVKQSVSHKKSVKQIKYL